MGSATTDPAPTVYEVIGKIVVIVAAGVALLAGHRRCDGRKFANKTRCATIEKDGRTARDWISHTFSGAYRVQQRDGPWAFFPDFGTLTLADRTKPCDFAVARYFQT
jgi:hypothetical protein